MPQLFENGIFSVNDANGSVGVGWELNFYVAGTTTRLDTYPTLSDAEAQTNPNPNPVLSDANGRFPPVWLTGGGYKVVLRDDTGVIKVSREEFADAGDTALNVTVGAAGDFATINEALIWMGGRRRTFGPDATASISLLSGFVMAEQVFALDGMDLGWITISSVDASVAVDHTAITEYIDTEDGIQPLFGASHNSVLPIIDVKFVYDSNTTSKDGVAVLFGSKVLFLPGAGVVKARNGLKVLYGSHASCYMPGLTSGGGGSGAGLVTGIDFTYAKNRALHVAFGSSAGLARSMLHHSEGDYCVYVIWGSTADLFQSNMSYSTGEAVLCRDGSIANCRDTNVSHSGVGYHAIHGGTINARSREPGDVGYSVWVGDGAKGCGTYAVLATNNSTIEAPDLVCDDNLSGRAVSAGQCSTVNISGGSVKNAAGTAIFATEGASINATDVDASNAGTIGIECDGAGTSVEFGNGIANSCGTYGISANNGGSVDALNADLDDNPIGIECSRTSVVNARSASIRRATTIAVNAIEGGRVNVHTAVLSSAGTFGIVCRAGEVVALQADCTLAGTTGVSVEYGGVVKFFGGTGTLSKAANAITADGIIYQ